MRVKSIEQCSARRAREVQVMVVKIKCGVCKGRGPRRAQYRGAVFVREKHTRLAVASGGHSGQGRVVVKGGFTEAVILDLDFKGT